jgi:hypothetical protein
MNNLKNSVKVLDLVETHCGLIHNSGLSHTDASNKMFIESIKQLKPLMDDNNRELADVMIEKGFKGGFYFLLKDEDGTPKPFMETIGKYCSSKFDRM